MLWQSVKPDLVIATQALTQARPTVGPRRMLQRIHSRGQSTASPQMVPPEDAGRLQKPGSWCVYQTWKT